MNPKADRLAAEAAAAANLRALATNPDVIALRVEKVRDLVDRIMWTAIVLGLGFTMVNVQVFAADGAAFRSLGWWAAWLLDPMVSLALIAVLLAEQTANRWGVEIGPWGRSARWVLLAGTYTMNTWEAIDAAVNGGGAWSRVVLHSVPPLLVFLAAEAVTDLREALNRAVTAAATAAVELAAAQAPEPARGTLFIDDTPTIPFPPIVLPALPVSPPVPPAQEETGDGAGTRGNGEEEDQEDDAAGEPPEPELTGTLMEQARTWWMHEREQGRTRKPVEVNDRIGASAGYIKGLHVRRWEDELAQHRPLQVVGR